MKILNKLFSASAVAIAGLAFTACVSEAPFESQKEGMLRLNAELRGDITTVTTRAAAGYDQSTLENNLVVYIQKENVGVVRKFLGLQSLQGTNVALQTGHYVLEGWTGDSVSASFDKKFYYGYKAVDVKEGNNAISLNCDIANVLASVNTEYVADKLSDLTVEIGHTRGSLTFDYDLIASDPKGEKKGYFMMPKGVTDLTYKISGKNTDGTPFNKEGEIKNALRAHDYQFVLKADASQITQGGALIQLEIVEVPTIDEVVTVFPAPSFKATMGGEALDLSSQLDFYKEECADINLRVLAYKGMPSLKLSFSENFPNVGGLSGLDIISDGTNSLPNGISTEKIRETVQIASSEGETVEVVEYWFSIPASFIKNLPQSSNEYAITFDVEDGKGFTNKLKLRWANTEEAIERIAPIGSYTQDEVFDFTAVSATKAVLYGALFDESVSDFGIRIREQGASEWNSLPGELTRAESKVLKFSVVAKDLKPATTYEYKSYAGDFEEEEPKTFTTEAKFIIPNASLEEWSDFSENSKVLLPGAGGVRSFWDSGNHGSATLDVTLTKNIGSPVHSGNNSAQLRSQTVAFMGIGKFAAGNLFAGTYLETQGTDGRLEFGREYNGSHPSALRLWANYRPGIVEKKGDQLAVGDTDKSQIYVALTTEPIEIRTKSSTRKLFDPDEDVVLAYGEVTWEEAFGPDGQLQEVNIPLKYKDSAKTLKPKYLVIVCSASKFGDYFCGGEGSTMIVDDFELIYE